MGNAALAGKCAVCAHFRNEPDYLEREIPGLATMSSAHASVRADDGICTLHERYLSARSTCTAFALHAGQVLDQALVAQSIPSALAGMADRTGRADTQAMSFNREDGLTRRRV